MTFNVGTVGVIVVLVGILAFLYFRKRSDEKGKEEIKAFIDALQSEFEDIVIDYIDKFDINNLDNLAIAEQEILTALVDILWDKAVTELDSMVTDKMTKVMIKKFLTKEYIAEVTERIFREIKVQKVYTSKYNEAIVEANREAILLEARATEFNNEIDKNEPVDFRKVEDIDPGTIINANGEIVEQELNPQHEDEIEDVDPEKDAVDVLDE